MAQYSRGTTVGSKVARYVKLLRNGVKLLTNAIQPGYDREAGSKWLLENFKHYLVTRHGQVPQKSPARRERALLESRKESEKRRRVGKKEKSREKGEESEKRRRVGKKEKSREKGEVSGERALRKRLAD